MAEKNTPNNSPTDISKENTAKSPSLAEQAETSKVQKNVKQKLETCRADVVTKLLNILQLGSGIKPFITNIFNNFCSSKEGLNNLTQAGDVNAKEVIQAIKQTPEWQGILALAKTDDKFLEKLAEANISVALKLKFIKENKDTPKENLRSELQKFLKGKNPETPQIDEKLDIKSRTSQIFKSYEKLFTPGFDFKAVKGTIKSDLRAQINKLRQEEKDRRSKVKSNEKLKTQATTVQEIVESTTKKTESNSMISSVQNIASKFSISPIEKQSDKFEVAFDLNILDVAGRIESKMGVDRYFDQMIVSADKKVDQYMDQYIKGKDLKTLKSSLILENNDKEAYLKTIPKWAIDGDLAADYVKYITEIKDGHPKNPHKTFNQYLKENLEISGLGLMIMQLMSMLKDVLPQLKGEGKKRKEELSTARTKLEELMGIKPKETVNEAKEANDTAKAYEALLINENWGKINISDLYSKSGENEVIDNREKRLLKDITGMGKMTEILNAKDDSVLGVARTKKLKWETMQKIYENKNKFVKNKEGGFGVGGRVVEWKDETILGLFKESPKEPSSTEKIDTEPEEESSSTEKETKSLTQKELAKNNLKKANIPDDTITKIMELVEQEKDKWGGKTIDLNPTGIEVDPDGLFNSKVFTYPQIKKDSNDFITMINKVYKEEVEAGEKTNTSYLDKKEKITSKDRSRLLENPNLGLSDESINDLKKIATKEQDKPLNEKTVYFGRGALKITDTDGKQHYFHYSKPEEFSSDEFQKSITVLGLKPTKKVVLRSVEKEKPVGIKLDYLKLEGTNPYKKYASKSQFYREAQRLNNVSEPIKEDRSVLQQKLATAYMDKYGNEMKGKPAFERLEELQRLVKLFYKGHVIDPEAERALIDTYGYAKIDPMKTSEKTLNAELAKMPEDVIIQNFDYNSRGTNIIMAKLFPSTIIG